MKLEVKVNDRTPKVGDVIAIKWKHNGNNTEGYLLSNQVLGNDDRAFKLLNLNGGSVAFDNNTIKDLMNEVARHSAVEAFEVFPQEQFKLTLQPIGGAK